MDICCYSLVSDVQSSKLDGGYGGLTRGSWGGGLGRRLDGAQEDHGEEDANFGLERVAELGQQRVEDGAGERLRGRDGAARVLEQRQAQVLLYGARELLRRLEHLAAILQQYLQQLQRQHLHMGKGQDYHMFCNPQQRALDLPISGHMQAADLLKAKSIMH